VSGRVWTFERTCPQCGSVDVRSLGRVENLDGSDETVYACGECYDEWGEVNGRVADNAESAPPVRED
jgi:hypothetical protein